MAYDGRQISLTPGVSMPTTNVAANSFFLIGTVEGCAMKL